MAEVSRLFAEVFDEEAVSESMPADEPLMSEALRIAEAMLFAAAEPLEESEIARRMPDALAVGDVLARLKQDYANRGVNLVRVGKKWLFRTASDLGWLLALDSIEPKKLSKAALETLAIIAYHQPVTRADIEGHPWCRDLQGHARCADRNGLGASAWTPPHAGASIDLRHQ